MQQRLAAAERWPVGQRPFLYARARHCRRAILPRAAKKDSPEGGGSAPEVQLDGAVEDDSKDEPGGCWGVKVPDEALWPNWARAVMRKLRSSAKGRGRPGGPEAKESQSQGCTDTGDRGQENLTCEVGDSITFAPWPPLGTRTSGARGQLCIESINVTCFVTACPFLMTREAVMVISEHAVHIAAQEAWRRKARAQGYQLYLGPADPEAAANERARVCSPR